MKKLLNTLYVTRENGYLGLDGENIVIYDDNKEIGRLPLHNLESIVSFGYRGTSPALMGACVEKNSFMLPEPAGEVSGSGNRKCTRQCDIKRETI